MKTDTTISFSLESLDATEWLHLVQEKLDDVDQYANFGDIASMLSMAESGLSASLYEKETCPIVMLEDIAKVDLDVFVYPHDLELPYEISASFGVVGDQFVSDYFQEFDVIIPFAKSVKLNFLIGENEITWQTETRNIFGQVVATPNITVSDNIILFDTEEPIFGVLRFKGKALGYRHTVSMFFMKHFDTVEELQQDLDSKDDTTKNDERFAPLFDGRSFGDTFFSSPAIPFESDVPVSSDSTNRTGYNKIENINNTVSVKWVTSEGKTETVLLKLKIPKCVEDFLATCIDGSLKNGGTTIIKNPLKYPVIYYSTCTGVPIVIHYLEES